MVHTTLSCMRIKGNVMFSIGESKRNLPSENRINVIIPKFYFSVNLNFDFKTTSILRLLCHLMQRFRSNDEWRRT